MQPEINWDDLRVFLALARAGRLAGAARAAQQDATTVGRRVVRLEKALGCALFEHGSDGQTLTEQGRRLLAHAEAMEAAALAVGQASGPGGSVNGTIRVSASEGFGGSFVAPRLAGFATAHPGVEVELIASTGFLNPSRREADIAIMLARPKGGPLIAGKLTDYRLGMYASAAYLAETGPIETLHDLAGRTLVGYMPDLIYAPELRYLAEVDEHLESRLRSPSINAQASMIAGGSGCGILPCFLGDAARGLVRVLSDAVAIERRFWLVVHRDMRQIRRIAAFTTWLRDEVAAAQPLLLGTRLRAEPKLSEVKPAGD